MKKHWANLRPFEKRVVVVVMSLVFIVFNVWFVFPYFSDWGRVKDRMGKAQRNLKMFEDEVRMLNNYSNELNRLQQEGQSVPAEDQTADFFRTIQSQQAISGVNILSSGKPSTHTNIFSLEQSQTITVQSGEQQLVNFLYNLGSIGGSAIRVRDLTLRPDGTRQQLSANVKLVASYQRKLKAPTPAAAAKAAPAPKSTGTNKPATATIRTTPPPPPKSAQTNKPSTSTAKPK